MLCLVAAGQASAAKLPDLHHSKRKAHEQQVMHAQKGLHAKLHG